MYGVLLIGFFNIFGEGFRVSGRLSQRLEGDGGLAACMNSDNRKLTLFLLIYTDPSVPALNPPSGFQCGAIEGGTLTDTVTYLLFQFLYGAIEGSRQLGKIF